MSNSPNGKLTHWLLGAIFSILMLGIGYFINENNRRITQLENEFHNYVRNHNVTVNEGYQRLSRIESKLDDVLRRLDKIEN